MILSTSDTHINTKSCNSCVSFILYTVWVATSFIIPMNLYGLTTYYHSNLSWTVSLIQYTQIWMPIKIAVLYQNLWSDQIWNNSVNEKSSLHVIFYLILIQINFIILCNTFTLMSATYLEVGPAVHSTFNIIPDVVLLMTAPIISSPVFTFWNRRVKYQFKNNALVVLHKCTFLGWEINLLVIQLVVLGH